MNATAKTGSAVPRTTDQSQIEELATAFSESWNTHDIARFAGLFAHDADFVNVVGMWWKNREEIEKAHAHTHSTFFKDSRLSVKTAAVKFLRPDLYLTVLDPETADFKQSAQEFLDRADAVIMHEGKSSNWQGVSLKPVAGQPVFSIRPPKYVTTEIADFVRSRLNAG